MLFACALGSAHAQPVISAEKIGRLVGEVVDDETGKPVPGVPVMVKGTTLVTSAGSDGMFRFLQVSPGTYQLVVAGDSYEPVQLSDVTVRPGRTTSLQITLKPRTVMTNDLVTAAGRKIQTVDEVPAATVVVPRKPINERNSYNLGDILNSVPGVAMNDGRIDIRGAGGVSTSGGSQVTVLIDGLPALTPGDAGIPVDLLPTGVIQRVEVVKGPASALYGSGAMGGVVNVVTRQPAEHPGIDLKASSGFYTNPERRDWIWWGQKIQRFVGAQGVLLRQSGPIGLLMSGGFHSDEGYRQYDDRKDYNFFGKLSGTISPQADVRVSIALAGTDHGDYETWRGYDSALFASVYDTLRYRTQTSYARVNGELRTFAWQNFSVSLRGGLFTTDQQVRQDTARSVAEEIRSNGLYGELLFTSTINSRIQLKYGGELQIDFRNVINTISKWQRTSSAFAQMEFTNNEDITASIGGRLDVVLNQTVEDPQEVQFSPRVGVNYHPLEGTVLRVLMGRGFRAPTLQERYAVDRFGDVQFKPNRKLTSEQNWHGEVGGSQQLDISGIQLSADLSLFVDEYFNLIEPIIDPADGNAMFTSDTRARILGSDFFVKGRIPQLSLSTVTGISSISASNLRTGATLQGRPSLVAHASVFWESPAMSIGIDYRYVARVSNVDPVLQAAVHDIDVRSPAQAVDFRMSFNMASLVRLPVTASINARNIFQYYSYNALGAVDPIRNIEAGLQATF
jgi:outer membrane receptor protein involved in Fe transport